MKYILRLCFLTLLFVSSCSKDDDVSQTYSDMPDIVTRHLFDLGISRTELPWLSLTYANGESVSATTAQKQILLAAMRSNGCGMVRLSLSRSSLADEVARHVLYCNIIGMKTMVMIKLGGIEEIYADDVEERSGEDTFWDNYPLSKIDDDLYETMIKSFYTALNSLNAYVDVIEVGNEVGWCDFNGDFPIQERGSGFVYDEETYSYSDIPEGITAGLRKCAEVANVTKTLAHSQLKQTTKPQVIIGGLNGADVDDSEWMVNAGGTIMYPASVIKVFKGEYPGQPDSHEDLLDALDGVSLHFYPKVLDWSSSSQTMIDEAEAYLHDKMFDITRVTAKPLHISEMGYSYDTYGTSKDYKRLDLFNAFFSAMDLTDCCYDWRGLYIYSWDQGDKALVVDGVEYETAKSVFK